MDEAVATLAEVNETRSNPTRREPRLSKSRVMAGLQCHKRLWLETYQRELIQYGAASNAAFAQGDAFGVLARALLAAELGVTAPTLIDTQRDPEYAVRATQTALATHSGEASLIFEAALRYETVLVRPDALLKNKALAGAASDEPSYTLIEVKASASPKLSHIRDCALQTWVARGCGLNIARIELAHVDTSFVYDGRSHLGLLKRQDISAQVEVLQAQVGEWVSSLSAMLKGDTQPTVAMGKHCRQPYTCPFVDHCTASAPVPTLAPPQFPVNLIPSITGKHLAKKLQDEGYEDLLTVPAEKLGRFAFVQTAYATGQAFHDVATATALLKAQPKPWAYFDFETISPAIPLWAGTRPFAHWPFQWSAHVEKGSAALEHDDFLDLSGANPAALCIEKMLAVTDVAQTIWAYNAAFERQAIMRLVAAYPLHADALTRMADKLQDLIPIVQACYYHPAMMGSYSIKSVLPAIAPELNYSDLDGVQDGNAAQGAFFEAIDANTTPARRAEIDASLRAYCKLDTWAMVVLVQRLLNPIC